MTDLADGPMGYLQVLEHSMRFVPQEEITEFLIKSFLGGEMSDEVPSIDLGESSFGFLSREGAKEEGLHYALRLSSRDGPVFLRGPVMIALVDVDDDGSLVVEPMSYTQARNFIQMVDVTLVPRGMDPFKPYSARDEESA